VRTAWRFFNPEVNMCKTITLGDDMHRFFTQIFAVESRQRAINFWRCNQWKFPELIRNRSYLGNRSTQMMSLVGLPSFGYSLVLCGNNYYRGDGKGDSVGGLKKDSEFARASFRTAKAFAQRAPK
jgi:hypothetical protein